MAEVATDATKASRARARLHLPFGYVGLPALSVLIAIALGAGMMALMGFDPLQAYLALWQGAFGNIIQISETLKTATPLLLCGLGIAFAFQAGAFNIGAVGQMYAGALAAVIVGGQFPGLPAPLHIFLSTLAAFIAGGLWALVPALLKVYSGASEIISTILLNYVGIYLVDYMISGPIKIGEHRDAPTSWPIVDGSIYPKLIPHSQLHMGLLIALAAMILLFIVMRYTTLGHRVRIVGQNPVAARHAGIRSDQVFILAFFFSGTLAGLAGASEILGYQTHLISGFAPNTGYDAIAVALLGGFPALHRRLSGALLRWAANRCHRYGGVAKLPAQLVGMIRVLAILAVLAASSPRIVAMASRGQAAPTDQPALPLPPEPMESASEARQTEVPVQPATGRD